MLKKVLATLVMGLSLVFATTLLAGPYLACDPNPTATYYIIVMVNDPATDTDDEEFKVSAIEDGSLYADLINFPAGVNLIRVRAGNVFDESINVPFEFNKVMPGMPSNIALVNIDGVAYLFSDAQESIQFYRVIVDGEDFVVDAEDDGSLLYSLDGLEDGVHSIEAYAINMWGNSNPAPFGFTKQLPSAPENLRLVLP